MITVLLLVMMTEMVEMIVALLILLQIAKVLSFILLLTFRQERARGLFVVARCTIFAFYQLYIL